MRVAGDDMIRVLLVDDQPLLISGFSMILSTEPDIEVVGTAATGREAVAAVATLRPDVVLMDVQMPVMDGIEATRAILSRPAREDRPAPKVVILTTFDRDDYLFDALEAGASGFLLKNADADDLVEAVHAVVSGHALLAPEVTRRVLARVAGNGSAGGGHQSGERAAKLELLTDREREVLVQLAQGLSNAEIAAALFLGEATVKTHVSNVLSKLHLRDRVQAVVFAYDTGLVTPGD